MEFPRGCHYPNCDSTEELAIFAMEAGGFTVERGNGNIRRFSIPTDKFVLDSFVREVFREHKEESEIPGESGYWRRVFKTTGVSDTLIGIVWYEQHLLEIQENDTEAKPKIDIHRNKQRMR